MVSAAMSESGDAAETAPFVADASERPFLPSVAPARRFWLAVSFVVSLSVHAVLFILLFVNFDPVDVTPAAADETPVEILTEPPPAAQPVAPPEEKQPTPPPPRTLEDTIATDAPRAANDEKTERDHARDKTAAPVVGKPSEVAASAPKTAPQPSFDEARAAIDPASEDPAENKPDAEIVRPLETKQDKRQPEKSTASQKPQTETAKPSTIGEQIAALEPLPDVQFGSAARKTPISGGNAKTTYLSIMYGIIMSHMHLPPGVAGGLMTPQVVVNFMLDSSGRVIRRELGKSSGIATLDMAALNAIAAGSPYAPPPFGMPLGVTFTYDGK